MASKNTKWLMAITPIADKANAEFISSTFIRYMTFPIMLSSDGNDPVTHCGVIIHSTDDVSAALVAFDAGVIPPVPDGTWESQGLDDATVLEIIDRMERKEVSNDLKRAVEFDAFAASLGLARIIISPTI